MAGYNLLACRDQAVEYNRDARARKEVDAARLRIRQVGSSALQSEEVQTLQGKLTPYGLELVAAQMAQILHYKADAIPEKYEL